ncbi:MAG: sigma-54-dependent Fis family transcriptional regulator [Gemmatimonadetes bacterium]|nr:sigma-54-dependent Fis family transcriptional regulator [Gemmatimonadota bacterium]MYG84815.1 sigma-54-dependent Fis family transcriptional regulator [Gemmatimonadota bacterium]MYJ90875.1 sigma-54-dependent Fis family transcriptional regulator [Gemmatimonadota bacterium]
MNSPTESVILLVEGSSRGRDEKHYGLTQRDHRVIAVENSDKALNVLATESPSVIISDLNAPGIDGLRLMGVALGRNPEVGVILMTDPGSMDLAVAAMKEGAYDVLEKPVYVEKLAAEIEKILDRQRIVQENQELLHQLDTRYGFENIVGRSASMQRIREQILQIADTQSTVLIFGESGTGKELVAHALHRASSRRNRSFVPVFCNALSEGVIESELFGHEKGAFTNAVKTYRGRFELADGGTLFLDEVGELAPSTQVKLLRVLQERKFQRVGSGNWLKTDTRVIAATNRDLEAEIESGRFREDLYYRLRVVTLSLPPLRERKEDLPLLIDHCIRRFGERENKPIERIDPPALEMLSTYHWPGNVRQLENCIEGMIVMGTGKTLTVADVPEFIRHTRPESTAVPLNEVPDRADDLSPDFILYLAGKIAEQRHVPVRPITDRALAVLAAVDWSADGASLRRCLETMILLADGDGLDMEDIPAEFLPERSGQSAANGEDGDGVDIRVGMTMKEGERRLIAATLAACGRNKARTARVLRIGQRTLFRKIKAYHLE